MMSNNKKIARNSLVLNVRMLISVVISLYTSRLVLATLGVEDFGIYNVVGGIITILTFLNTSMSGATSRFITFAIGKEYHQERINNIFSSTMNIHILIAGTVFILGETIGLYFFEKELFIPNNKIHTAQIVYQLSLFCSVFSILQIPYSASLIAYEKMNIYAYIEILRVLLRLGIVYVLLSFDPIDRLILYGYLVLFIAMIITFLYYVYCTQKLKTCNFVWYWNKQDMLPIFSFSIWDLYGNACVAIREQGTVILINNHFGVALNAAAGIASQAGAAISVFTNSVTMAFRPQIIKEYANGNIPRMESLLSLEFSSCLLLISMIVTPLYLYMSPIMEIWLKNVPQNTVEFCKMILIINSVLIVNSIVVTAIHATGRIKSLSFIGGTLFLIALACTYFCFRANLSVMYAYYGWFVFSLIILVVNIAILKKRIENLSLCNIIKPQMRPMVAIGIVQICVIYLATLFPVNILMFCVILLINVTLLTAFSFFIWILPIYGWNIKALLKTF